MIAKLLLFLLYSLLHETQGKMVRKCNVFSKCVENRYDISKKSSENRKVFKITTTLDGTVTSVLLVTLKLRISKLQNRCIDSCTGMNFKDT